MRWRTRRCVTRSEPAQHAHATRAQPALSSKSGSAPGGRRSPLTAVSQSSFVLHAPPALETAGRRRISRPSPP